jgi:hypothetical protein
MKKHVMMKTRTLGAHRKQIFSSCAHIRLQVDRLGDWICEFAILYATRVGVMVGYDLLAKDVKSFAR